MHRKMMMLMSSTHSSDPCVFGHPSTASWLVQDLYTGFVMTAGGCTEWPTPEEVLLGSAPGGQHCLF